MPLLACIALPTVKDNIVFKSEPNGPERKSAVSRPLGSIPATKISPNTGRPPPATNERLKNSNDFSGSEDQAEAILKVIADHGYVLVSENQNGTDWKDYTQQSPRIDGRYQIFINGEQLAADWKSPFGFADPVEGDAFIQDLITHWAVLSADPVIETT